MVFAVVRIRGTIHLKPDIKKTLKLLRLTRVNHCVLLEENPVNKGMLQKVKDYTTWGEINTETAEKLLKKRGMLVGDKPLTDDYVKETTSYDSIEQFAQAVVEGTIAYKDLPEVKPLFRLHPPRKGYEGIKRSVTTGGSLGYRGKAINTLIERML